MCDQYKTAYQPPNDIQFEEYGSKAQTLTRQPASVEKVKKKKGSVGFFSKKAKKVSMKSLLFKACRRHKKIGACQVLKRRGGTVLSP